MNDIEKVDLYGADCREWLRRWDEGKAVWTIEMGGLGPGYEQCIHITMAEILRIMLDKKYDVTKWDDENGSWKKDKDDIEHMAHENPVIDKLGLSGAQWGAALSLAAHFYRKGPVAIMGDEQVKDRHIQVQRTFPQ